MSDPKLPILQESRIANSVFCIPGPDGVEVGKGAFERCKAAWKFSVRPRIKAVQFTACAPSVRCSSYLVSLFSSRVWSTSSARMRQAFIIRSGVWVWAAPIVQKGGGLRTIQELNIGFLCITSLVQIWPRVMRQRRLIETGGTGLSEKRNLDGSPGNAAIPSNFSYSALQSSRTRRSPWVTNANC